MFVGGEMEQMRRSWLGRSKYILLVLVALLFIPALYAQPNSMTDVPLTALKESPICKFLSEHIDRPISSFERDFGPAISSKTVRTYGDRSAGKTGQILTIQFAQPSSATYVAESPNARDIIMGA